MVAIKMSEFDFDAKDCAKMLEISITSFNEIKYRLGYKGKKSH